MGPFNDVAKLGETTTASKRTTAVEAVSVVDVVSLSDNDAGKVHNRNRPNLSVCSDSCLGYGGGRGRFKVEELSRRESSWQIVSAFFSF